MSAVLLKPECWEYECLYLTERETCDFFPLHHLLRITFLIITFFSFSLFPMIYVSFKPCREGGGFEFLDGYIFSSRFLTPTPNLFPHFCVVKVSPLRVTHGDLIKCTLNIVSVILKKHIFLELINKYSKSQNGFFGQCKS